MITAMCFKSQVVSHDTRSCRKARNEEFGELKTYDMWMRMKEQTETHDDVRR